MPFFKHSALAVASLTLLLPLHPASGFNGLHGGNIWVWGANERGQLGLSAAANDQGTVGMPVLAHKYWKGWHGINVTKVAAAHYSGEWALVLSSEGNVYSFGDCSSRNLGTGETVCSQTNCKAGPSGGGSIRCSAEPRQLVFPAGAGAIVDVAAGDDFALASDVHGNVYGWGEASYGQIGTGCCQAQSCARACSGGFAVAGGVKYQYSSPVPAQFLNTTRLGAPVRSVICGSNFGMAQVEDGRVFSFGLNSNSQLALGFDNSSSRPLALPQEAVALRGSRDIRVGSVHGLALMPDGSVLSWGDGKFGQTGQGNAVMLARPTRVPLPGPAVLIGAGQHTSFVLLSSGKLFAFGKNTDGNLGIAASPDCGFEVANTCERAPREVPGLPSFARDPIVAISGAQGHTLILARSGTVYSSGDNAYKQLGVSSCASGSSKCFGFTAVPALVGQQVVGIASGLNWAVAWRSILSVPSFNPPPGEYGAINLTPTTPPEVRGDLKIYYTLASSLSPPNPNFTNAEDGSAVRYEGVELAVDKPQIELRPNEDGGVREYKLKALAACGSCGASYSAVGEVRYSIVKKVSPPSFKSSPTRVADPAYICATGPSGAPPPEMLGQACGGRGLGVLDAGTCGSGECVYWTGLWAPPALVEISVEPAEASVYYTTDGSVPTDAAQKYSRPFAMPGGGINVTVRAVGVLPGYRDSQISPALFALGVDSLSGGRVQLQELQIVAACIGGMVCVCCMAACCLGVRLRRLRRIAEAEHMPPPAAGRHSGKVAVTVHEIAHPNPLAQVPTTLLAVAQEDGVLRPISNRQLQGLHVEAEVHAEEDQFALSNEEMHKFAAHQDYHKWKRLTGEEAERHARHHLHHLQHSPQQHAAQREAHAHGAGGGASVSGCLDTGWHPADGHGERLPPPQQHGRAEHTLAYSVEHTRVDQMMLGRVPEAAQAQEEDTSGLDGGGACGGGGSSR